MMSARRLRRAREQRIAAALGDLAESQREIRNVWVRLHEEVASEGADSTPRESAYDDEIPEAEALDTTNEDAPETAKLVADFVTAIGCLVMLYILYVMLFGGK